ncbi:hypothetical protein DFS34DRAFT_597237 [Phlyctochytrium arcticum]|nr:hypothetical protein DFS34DRAFT_597237 [Phlyctochytrium arcticum]
MPHSFVQSAITFNQKISANAFRIWQRQYQRQKAASNVYFDHSVHSSFTLWRNMYRAKYNMRGSAVLYRRKLLGLALRKWYWKALKRHSVRTDSHFWVDQTGQSRYLHFKLPTHLHQRLSIQTATRSYVGDPESNPIFALHTPFRPAPQCHWPESWHIQHPTSIKDFGVSARDRHAHLQTIHQKRATAVQKQAFVKWRTSLLSIYDRQQLLLSAVEQKRVKVYQKCISVMSHKRHLHLTRTATATATSLQTLLKTYFSMWANRRTLQTRQTTQAVTFHAHHTQQTYLTRWINHYTIQYKARTLQLKITVADHFLATTYTSRLVHDAFYRIKIGSARRMLVRVRILDQYRLHTLSILFTKWKGVQKRKKDLERSSAFRSSRLLHTSMRKWSTSHHLTQFQKHQTKKVFTRWIRQVHLNQLASYHDSRSRTTLLRQTLLKWTALATQKQSLRDLYSVYESHTVYILVTRFWTHWKTRYNMHHSNKEKRQTQLLTTAKTRHAQTLLRKSWHKWVDRAESSDLGFEEYRLGVFAATWHDKARCLALFRAWYLALMAARRRHSITLERP